MRKNRITTKKEFKPIIKEQKLEMNACPAGFVCMVLPGAGVALTLALLACLA